MLFTVNHISGVANRIVSDNMVSAIRGLQFAGATAGLTKPHRLAMFLAQTAHESMGWVHDREIWGPTAAQKRYEGRSDLGNTQPGDGSKFRGYTPMQITGRYNTTKFYKWCLANITHMAVPNFVDNPALMNTDPWEGIGPIWYWTHGKPTSLNHYADYGDFRKVTQLINGGYNGLSDRYRYYGRAALVLLGKNPTEISKFQRENGLKADGIVGENTVAALHKALVKLPEVKFNAVETKKPESFSLFDMIKSFFNLFRGK